MQFFKLINTPLHLYFRIEYYIIIKKTKMLRMSKFEKLNTLFICILFFGYYIFFKMDKKNSFFILLFSYNSFFIILPQPPLPFVILSHVTCFILLSQLYYALVSYFACRIVQVLYGLCLFLLDIVLNGLIIYDLFLYIYYK